MLALILRLAVSKLEGLALGIVGFSGPTRNTETIQRPTEKDFNLAGFWEASVPLSVAAPCLQHWWVFCDRAEHHLARR